MPAPPRPEKLTRGQRLRRRPLFLEVQERGRRVSGSSYLLLALARQGGQGSGARLGITVSKKVGKAAVRNQVKRWVRESYRRMSDLAPSGTDLVVVARATAPERGFAGTSSELRGLLRRLRQPGR